MTVQMDRPQALRDPAVDRKKLERDLAAVEGSGKWLRRLLVLLVIAGAIAGGVAYKIKTAPPPPAGPGPDVAAVGAVQEPLVQVGSDGIYGKVALAQIILDGFAGQR